MELAEIAVKIRVSVDESGSDLEGILRKIKKLSEESEKANNSHAANMSKLWTESVKVFSVIQEAWQKSIVASNEYKNALMGLQSVTTANGITQSEVTKAVESVTDQFFSAAEAATAFKNLLSRGYTLEQATATIHRLKDAAAFGRQANLQLGQAVVSATEGIRNENSALVDNAGVTKNVAKMWQDYAKARGLVTAEMTQAQRVEAEYLGIMEETKAQIGDIEKLSGTLAGAQAATAKAGQDLAISFGDALTPISQLGTEIFGSILQGILGITEAAPGLTTGLTSAAGAMVTFVSAAAGLEKIKTLLGHLGAAKALVGPMGALAAVVGVAAGAYTVYQRTQEKIREDEAKRITDLRESVRAEQERIDRLGQLEKRYVELDRKSSLSLGEAKELASIRRTLADAYDIEAESVQTTADAYYNLAAARQAAENASNDKLLKDKTEIAEGTWKGIRDAASEIMEKRTEALEKYNETRLDTLKLNEQVFKLSANQKDALGLDPEEIGRFNDYLGKMNEDGRLETLGLALMNVFGRARVEEIAERMKTLDLMAGATWKGILDGCNEKLEEIDFSKGIIDSFDASLQALKNKGVEIPEGFADTFFSSLNAAFDPTALESPEKIKKAMEFAFDTVFAELAQSPVLSKNIDAIQSVMKTVNDGLEPSPEQMDAFTEAWDALLGEGGPLQSAMAQLVGVIGQEGAEAAINGMLMSLVGFPEVFDAFSASSEQAAGELAGWTTMAQNTETALEATKKSYGELENQVGSLTKRFEANGKALEDVGRKQKWVDNARDAVKEFKALDSEAQKNVKNVKKLNETLLKLGLVTDGSATSLRAAEQGIEAFGDSLDQETLNLLTDAAQMRASLEELEMAAQIAGSAGLDTTEIDNAIAIIKAALTDLERYAAEKGVDLSSLGNISNFTKPKGGGGGGGKKNGAEEAARAAEQARKEAIRKDYDLISHKRHMNEITLEMELSMIEKIRQAHKLNAEEIMEWERKVYDLKKEIRARDAGSIDTAGDALITALEARYQAMLDAEVGRLDASREAWTAWRDDSVKAIEDQIAALEELSKTEDREKTDQEELRKIAKLRQDIEFEQDEYNRMKLQQQLEQALESREERLRRLEREDLKETLRKDIEAINERMEAEVTALDKEQTAIEKAYEEQMKSAAIRAEAEKMLMLSSQEEIIGLIGEFAPDYNALGKTLGEKLLDGFKDKVGDIVNWFEGLNQTLHGIQDAAAAEAMAAAGQLMNGYNQRQAQEASLPPTIVEQTNNFYEPMETPAQVARRIQQTNEELGALLYGG